MSFSLPGVPPEPLGLPFSPDGVPGRFFNDFLVSRGLKREAKLKPLGHPWATCSHFVFYVFFGTSLFCDSDSKCLQNGSKTEPGEEPGDL